MPSHNSNSRSTGGSEIKIRQLQQYLYRPGRIPTAPHPFVKQEILKAETKPIIQPNRHGTGSSDPMGGTGA